MIPETIAPLSNDPLVKLPAMTSLSCGSSQPEIATATPLLHPALGHDLLEYCA